jgi:hypothetical protein
MQSDDPQHIAEIHPPHAVQWSHVQTGSSQQLHAMQWSAPQHTVLMQ